MYANRTTIGVSRVGPLTPRVFADVHCHCLANVDDGPPSCALAVALCLRLVREGIGTVIATPHQLGRFEGRTSAAMVREKTRELNDALADEGVDLRVLPGAEVRLDERIGDFLLEDAVLTLADMHRHVLVELPDGPLINIEPLLVQLAGQNLDVIIAHPERNAQLCRHPQALWRWLNCGASLQVTAASLVGYWGPAVRRAAWQLVAQGWVAVVATDTHDCRQRDPCMSEAFLMIGARFGGAIAHLLCIENPTRVLAGENLIQAFSLDEQEVK